MSLTRSFLKSIGVEAEKVEAIIEAHAEVINRMQAEIDELKPFKVDAKKLPSVQKELDEAKKTIEESEDWKKKLEEEKKAFEEFKKEVEAKDTLNAVKDAYKAILKANNVDDKRFDAILKVTDFSELKLNDKGKFDNEKELAEAIKADWKDFIVNTGSKGEHVETPPAGNGGNLKTKEDIMKIKNASERQKAIAENPQLFGIEAE